jgi:hypothetical protein
MAQIPQIFNDNVENMQNRPEFRAFGDAVARPRLLRPSQRAASNREQAYPPAKGDGDWLCGQLRQPGARPTSHRPPAVIGYM